MAQHVDDGDVHDRLELAQELVGNHGPEDGGEVAEHGKGVVDDGGLVLCKVELLLQVQGQDGLHAVVREPLAELIAHDEKHRLGVRVLLHGKTFSIKTQQGNGLKLNLNLKKD